MCKFGKTACLVTKVTSNFLLKEHRKINLTCAFWDEVRPRKFWTKLCPSGCYRKEGTINEITIMLKISAVMQ